MTCAEHPYASECGACLQEQIQELAASLVRISTMVAVLAELDTRTNEELCESAADVELQWRGRRVPSGQDAAS